MSRLITLLFLCSSIHGLIRADGWYDWTTTPFVGANFTPNATVIPRYLFDPLALVNAAVNATFDYGGSINNGRLLSYAYNSALNITITNLTISGYNVYALGALHTCKGCTLAFTRLTLTANDNSCVIRQLTASTIKDFVSSGHIYGSVTSDAVAPVLHVESTVFERMFVTTHFHIDPRDGDGMFMSEMSGLFGMVHNGVRIRRGSAVIHIHGNGSLAFAQNVNVLFSRYVANTDPLAWGHGNGAITTCPTKRQMLIVVKSHGNITNLSLFGARSKYSNVSLARLFCAVILTDVSLFTDSGVSDNSAIMDRFLNYLPMAPENVESYRQALLADLGLDSTKFTTNIEFLGNGSIGTAIWPDAGFLVPV